MNGKILMNLITQLNKSKEVTTPQVEEDKAEHKINEVEGIQLEQKFSEVFSDYSSLISDETMRSSLKLIKRKMRSLPIFEGEFLILGFNSQNTTKYTSICNYKWIDLEDPEVIMQEFYWNSIEENELHTIEEEPIECGNTSGVISHRTSLSHTYFDQNNESMHAKTKDYLKYFHSDKYQYQLYWWELSENSLNGYKSTSVRV